MKRVYRIVGMMTAALLSLTAAACGYTKTLSKIAAFRQEQPVYIEEIVCDENEFPPCDASVPYQKGLIEEGFDRYVEKTYEEGLSVQIKCFFSPRNANAFPDGKPFEYIYKADDDKYTVEPQGDGTCIIRFKQSAVCDVTVKTLDGSNKKLKIRVNALGGWSEYF